jgi:hypothetical protein
LFIFTSGGYFWLPPSSGPISSQPGFYGACYPNIAANPPSSIHTNQNSNPGGHSFSNDPTYSNFFSDPTSLPEKARKSGAAKPAQLTAETADGGKGLSAAMLR